MKQTRFTSGSCHDLRGLASATYRHLQYGLVVWVLLAFTPDAGAESPKEQLQGTIDRVIELFRTIRSPADVERVRSSLRPLHAFTADGDEM